MKKLGALIVAGAMFVAIGLVGTWENTYTKTAEVIAVEAGTIYVEDKYGECWAFSTDDSYEVGEVLKLKMSTNYTDAIYDDYILEVK